MTDTDATAQFSQATVLGFFDEYLAADDAVAEAVGARKDLRARIKGEGISLAAFDKARKDARMSGEEREERDRHYRRIMAFIGKPVGFQGAFSFDQSPEDAAQVDVSRLKAVDADGYEAGRAGHKASLNSWTPGTEEHSRFHTAWLRGQAEKVTAEIQPADAAPKRSRGRPRKNGAQAAAPNGTTPIAEQNAEARADGEADGAAGTTTNAVKWPMGTPGHGDYELGRAAAQTQH
jgi:hypothetical protein